MSNSSKRPEKPYPEFPLYAHPAGYWAKKVRGQMHYFGRWGRVVSGKLTRLDGETWRDALEQYKAQADDLHAGRTPRVTGGGLTVGMLCNHFLTAKTRKIESGELGSRMLAEYKLVTDLIVSAFGANRLVDDLAADDFAQLRVRMANRWGPYRLKVGVVRVRSVFKYGTANALIEKAVRYGSEFVVPSGTTLRRHRMKVGERMIEADDLRTLLDAADAQMKAMVLLGLNCGFGNADLAMLAFTHLDLDKGWVNLPRAKTGVPRRCPLWPETVTAIRAAIEERPKPAGYAESGIVFLTERGTALVRPATGTSRSDILAVRFRRLLRRAGLGRHVGLGFYTLRRVHRTAADGARDQVAANSIMGHIDTSMAATYRQRIDDDRLKAVADHVRDWLMAGRGAKS